jgi:hypothetical protein
VHVSYEKIDLAKLVDQFGSEEAANAYLVENAREAGKKAAQQEGMTVRQHMRSIFGDRYDHHNEQQPAAPASDRAKPEAVPVARWHLERPSRFPGYRKQLYDLLRVAHSAGEPCPTARNALDAWKVNKPPIFHSVTDQMIVFYDADGNTKTADIAAIAAAIRRLT